MDLRKRVLTFYGLGLVCLIVSLPLSLLYNPIMIGAAMGVAFFIGLFLVLSFASTYSRTIMDIYEKDNIRGVYKYAGTINPSSLAIVAGIISFLLVAFSFAGIVDWEYLGLTMPNIFTVVWAITGVLSLLGGIMARPLAKRKSKPEYEKKEL